MSKERVEVLEYEIAKLRAELAELKKEHDDNVTVLKDYADTIKNLGARSQQLRAALSPEGFKHEHEEPK